MMKCGRLAVVLVVAVLVLGMAEAAAGNLLVSQYMPYQGTGYAYGYGLESWDNFSAALDAATGNQVTVTGRFDNLAEMLSYDALLLVTRDTWALLNATEESNLATYIATGRRVAMMGENAVWTAWNNDVLAIVGGSFAGDTGHVTTNAIVSNEITNGASPVYLPAAGEAGTAVGGVPLYDINFATLWGAAQNTLTVLDINVWDDTYGSREKNAQFGINVAEWLAASPADRIPEPATLTLVAFGGLGLLARRRRKR